MGLNTKVICDNCGLDYSTLSDSGGMIFNSTAVCPDCTGAILSELVQSGDETNIIDCVCPAGTSFADFVDDWRCRGMR